MAALFPTPMTAPRRFVGTVDATHDNCRATARTLEQLQGGQRSSCAEIVPMGAARMHRADRIVTVASACAGVFVVVLLAAERLFA